MSLNPAFAHYLFGIYVLEVYKFFKSKFGHFHLLDKTGNQVDINTQVYYGTPRDAFRKYQTTNGKVVLPLINFYITDYERQPQFEPVNVKIALRDSLDINNSKIQMMQAPGVFTFNMQVSIFAPGRKEMDYMLHALYNSFPKGEVSLVHFPDMVNYPNIYLLMPFAMDPSVQDETEIEGLDEKETLDIIKVTFAIKCNKAFVPYDAYEVPIINNIDFNFLLNDIISGNVTPTIFSNFSKPYILPTGIKTIVNDVTTTNSI